MYTQIVNGKKSSLHLCSACASGESLFDNFGRTICSYSSDISKSTLYGVSYAEYTPYSEGSKSNHKIQTDSVKGKTAENFITNGNLESSTFWKGYYSGTTNSSSWSTEKLFGQKSLSMTSTSDSSGFRRYQQTVSIPSAGTYTLSAYVKTSSYKYGASAFHKTGFSTVKLISASSCKD